MPTDFQNAIIGQTNLLNKINSFTIDSLPHSILIIGDLGCGKHTLCKYIAGKFGLDLQLLDNNIKQEDIENILFNPNPCLYIVELDNAIPKFQNTILKLVEEPTAGVFVVGLTSNTNNLLLTLSNRCQKWYFEKYNKEELTQFIKDKNKTDLLLSVFNTPGQIILGQEHPIEEMKNLAINMLDRIGNASIPNTLSISDKIAWKDEKDKFNLDIFLQVLEKIALEKVINSEDKKYLKEFKLINQLRSRLNLCISCQRTFEEFLIQLKEVGKDDTA